MYWPITIKFRIHKHTSKPQTNYRCCLWFSFLVPYWLISGNTITFHNYFWCSQFCEFHSKLSMRERANHSLLLSVSLNGTVDTEAKLAHNDGKHSLSRLVVLIKTSQTWPSILGFHMTWPKFKLRNYRFFWVSTFTWYYSTLKPVYKQIFGSKRFFVLQHWTLSFLSFAWHSILLTARKAYKFG